MKKLVVAFCLLFSVGASAEMNLTFAPIGVLAGMINGTLDWKINDSWSAGGSLLFWNVTLGDWTFHATGAGVQATWYEGGTFHDGWYVSPGISYATVSADYSFLGTTGSGSGSATALGVVGGYGWYWNTFNMSVGLGIATGLGSSNLTVTDSGGTTQSTSVPTSAGLDFRIGWVF